jgi:16S rRNA (cytidine1402-2'-O)-methyltransferase
VLAALVVSGLPTTPFVFDGFLARKGAARTERIDAMRHARATTVVLEAPPRVAATLAELRDALGADRPAVVARELTKLHEEVQRGTLGDLADAFASRTVRGECVLLVAPAGPAGPVGDEEIRSELARAIAGGATRRDAATQAAAALGVARRRAYELSVGLPSVVANVEP